MLGIVVRIVVAIRVTIKINTDLERMGELAVNIAERALSLMYTVPAISLAIWRSDPVYRLPVAGETIAFRGVGIGLKHRTAAVFLPQRCNYA